MGLKIKKKKVLVSCGACCEECFDRGYELGLKHGYEEAQGDYNNEENQ